MRYARRTQCLSLNRNPPEPKPLLAQHPKLLSCEGLIMEKVTLSSWDSTERCLECLQQGVSQVGCGIQILPILDGCKSCPGYLAECSLVQKSDTSVQFRCSASTKYPVSPRGSYDVQNLLLQPGRIHKRTTSCVRMSSKAWTKPRKSP